ncbi:MAG: hypothetical protein HOO96_14675 [Polyangiaceae bacterium]|nr:hypothetical protein [Polyangiaceae bacterium]
MSGLTGGAMGAVEMIVATSACGVIYAVFAGQPLTIRGGTGPLLVFTGLLYGTCKQYELPFLPTYAWVGLWTALFVVALGLSGASRLIHRLTRLTDEIFAALISIIFVYQAVASVLHAFPTSHIPDDTALFGLVLALGTYTVARALSRFRKTPYLRPPTAKVWPTSGRRSRWSAWCSPGACCPPSRCRTSTPPRRWKTVARPALRCSQLDTLGERRTGRPGGCSGIVLARGCAGARWPTRRCASPSRPDLGRPQRRWPAGRAIRPSRAPARR